MVATPSEYEWAKQLKKENYVLDDPQAIEKARSGRRNPRRQAKKQMMRLGNLSSRQWRKFRKEKTREAKGMMG